MRSVYSRKQLIEAASLTEMDLQEVSRCRGAHNRLGFGYQLGFVRLFNRFPAQQPFELADEIVTFASIQLDIDTVLIFDYAKHHDAISDHQIRIRDYLQLRRFGEVELSDLEQFLFEEACRLEQTAALQTRAEEYLKTQCILLPADSTLIRIIGEQRQLAQARIHDQIAAHLPMHFECMLDELLQVPADLEGLTVTAAQSQPTYSFTPRPCWY